MKTHTRKLAPLALFLAATAALAQPAQRPDPSPQGQAVVTTQPADGETVVSLELSPAPQPDPAFRYTLIPPLSDRTPGSAAPLYLNAILMLPDKITYQGKEQDFPGLVGELIDKSQADLKNDPEIRALVNRPASLDLLRYASRRQTAGWDTTLREQGYEALLPYLNHIRSTANFLSLRARVRLADGDVADSLRTAQILFGLADHMRDQAVLVQSLVGTGITRLGLTQIIENVIQHPNAPNLYWALAAIPRPMFGMRDAMSWEKIALRNSLTPLRGRSPEQLSAAEWEQVAREFSRMLSVMSTINRTQPSPQDQLAATALAVTYYPRAKQQLIDLGIPADQVNAMPAPQAIGMAMLHTFDHWTDEMTKWSSLPYHQAAPLIRKTTDDLLAAKSRDFLNPAFAVIPSVDRATATVAQLDRHIAALQTVEALRAHAATHDGKLPATLADITDTPAPLDPTTGKTFAYTRTSDTAAELSSPVPPNEKRKNFALRYVIKLRPAK